MMNKSKSAQMDMKFNINLKLENTRLSKHYTLLVSYKTYNFKDIVSKFHLIEQIPTNNLCKHYLSKSCSFRPSKL